MCLCILTSCNQEIIEPSSTGEFNKTEDIITKIENSDSENIYDELENVIEDFQYFSDEDVLKTILDPQYSESTKHLVVELIPPINYGQGLLNQYPFEKLLNDVTVETSVRIALINTLSFEKSNLSLLKDIVLKENGGITTNAMRKIERIYPNLALNISNTIIKNYENYGEYQIKSAVMVKSDFLADMRFSKGYDAFETEIDDYIKFCIKMYDLSIDSTFKDSMIFSLMNIYNINAVKAIIMHSQVDSLLKKTCVKRNYITFKATLEKELSEDTIRCIIYSMEIEPIKGLAEDFENKILVLNKYNTTELKELVQVMKKGGISIKDEEIMLQPKYEWVEQ